MGDIADLILEGFLDYETGQVIDGESPGYPRTKRKKRNNSKDGPQCPQCGRRLKTEQGLADHMADKHGLGPEE